MTSSGRLLDVIVVSFSGLAIQALYSREMRQVVTSKGQQWSHKEHTELRD